MRLHFLELFCLFIIDIYICSLLDNILSSEWMKTARTCGPESLSTLGASSSEKGEPSTKVPTKNQPLNAQEQVTQTFATICIFLSDYELELQAY